MPASSVAIRVERWFGEWCRNVGARVCSTRTAFRVVDRVVGGVFAAFKWASTIKPSKNTSMKKPLHFADRIEGQTGCAGKRVLSG
jgi:hypothetical protein